MAYTQARQALAKRLIEELGPDRLFAAACAMFRDQRMEADPAVKALIEGGGWLDLDRDEVIAFIEGLDEKAVMHLEIYARCIGEPAIGGLH
jgi:hypothetical protein